MIDNNVESVEFDTEWIQLILEAKNLGITKEEIQSFLKGKIRDKVSID